MANDKQIQADIEYAFKQAFEIRKICPKCKSKAPIITTICGTCAIPLKIEVNASKLGEMVEKMYASEIIIGNDVQSTIKSKQLADYLIADILRRNESAVNLLFPDVLQYYSQLMASSTQLKATLGGVVDKIQQKLGNKNSNSDSKTKLPINPFRNWLANYSQSYDNIQKTAKTAQWKAKIIRKPLSGENRDAVKSCKASWNQLQQNQEACIKTLDILDQLNSESIASLHKSALQPVLGVEAQIAAVRRQIEIQNAQNSINALLNFVPEFVSQWRENHA